MVQQQNIADKLRHPRSPWRTVVAVTAIVLVGVAGVFIGGAMPQPPTGRDGTAIVHLTGAPGKPTAPQVTHKLMTPHQAKSTTPPPPPEPVYVPPAGGGGGVVNPDGSVSGPGCPPPYINSGGSCHPAICEVLEDGTEIPCAVSARVARFFLD